MDAKYIVTFSVVVVVIIKWLILRFYMVLFAYNYVYQYFYFKSYTSQKFSLTDTEKKKTKHFYIFHIYMFSFFSNFLISNIQIKFVLILKWGKCHHWQNSIKKSLNEKKCIPTWSLIRIKCKTVVRLNKN